MDVALRSAKLMGLGLFGIDVKEVNGKPLVIEINDNPNIDVDIEDSILKDKLYDLIIESIYNRIELAKNIQKPNFGQKTIRFLANL